MHNYRSASNSLSYIHFSWCVFVYIKLYIKNSTINIKSVIVIKISSVFLNKPPPVLIFYFMRIPSVKHHHLLLLYFLLLLAMPTYITLPCGKKNWLVVLQKFQLISVSRLITLRSKVFKKWFIAKSYFSKPSAVFVVSKIFIAGYLLDWIIFFSFVEKIYRYILKIALKLK